MPDAVKVHGVRAVMVFVDDPRSAAMWWGEQFDATPVDEDPFWWIDIAGIELGFHPADDSKNPRGASTVAYWAVDDIDAVRSQMIAAGCTPLRGPLRVSPQRQICQLTDPFGVVFGLDGP